MEGLKKKILEILFILLFPSFAYATSKEEILKKNPHLLSFLLEIEKTVRELTKDEQEKILSILKEIKIIPEFRTESKSEFKYFEIPEFKPKRKDIEIKAKGGREIILDKEGGKFVKEQKDTLGISDLIKELKEMLKISKNKAAILHLIGLFQLLLHPEKLKRILDIK